MSLIDEIFGGSSPERDKRAKRLEQVRGLLAKAAGTDNPVEAETFRQHADKLMTMYTIEEWQLAQESEGEGQRQPEVRWMDFAWWRGNAFRDQLYWMFDSVARHCRCRSVTSKLNYNFGDEPGNYRMPVVGLPSDLDWFDMLFTNLMLTMIRRVDPQADTSKSVDENMATMREAGMPWADALNRLALAGIVPSIAAEAAQVAANETGAEVEFNDDDKYCWDGKGRKKLFFSKKQYERTITSYRQWCARTGHPQSKVSQASFRRHFADGFAAEITDRLYRMNRESTAAYDADHAAGSMAIAIRDIKVVIDEMVYTEWPDLRPHPPNCDCDIHHRCSDPKCQRYNCVQARKPVRASRGRVPKAEKIDYEARAAGRAAGSQVNLSNNQDNRLRGAKELR